MILFMGTYNVQEGSDTGAIVVENIPNQSYTEYTQVAVDTAFSGLQGFGSAFVAIALFFFAFTTIMSYYYISETNVAYIMGERDQRFGTWVVKIIVLAATFLGTVRTADMAWLIGDIGLGLMVWVNVIGMLILTKPALIVLKDYERQKKEGKDPSFDPQPLGIKEADFWTKDK